MDSRRHLIACLLAAACAVAVAAAPASAARQTQKKAIWGPVEVGGVSQFPIYRDLGVGIYQTGLNWATIAPERPASPRDPADPAYRWPAYLDQAIAEARRHRIRVAVNLTRAPGWANGGRAPEWAPDDPQDFADFAHAASRRYPGVSYWLVWGEPNRSTSFQPMPANSPTGPRRYAALLDAAYTALKQAGRRDVVVGGNTFTSGQVVPMKFLRWMTLKRRGRTVRPRMDMYGHNPFGPRRPYLRDRDLGRGMVDFGTLDTFARQIDRYYASKAKPRRRGRRSRGRARRAPQLKLFLSEYTMPTGQRSHVFGDFFVSERTAAAHLESALKIARRWKRIHTLGWFRLYDEDPRPDGLETLWGLLRSDGSRKPAYYVFRRG